MLEISPVENRAVRLNLGRQAGQEGLSWGRPAAEGAVGGAEGDVVPRRDDLAGRPRHCPCSDVRLQGGGGEIDVLGLWGNCVEIGGNCRN